MEKTQLKHYPKLATLPQYKDVADRLHSFQQNLFEAKAKLNQLVEEQIRLKSMKSDSDDSASESQIAEAQAMLAGHTSAPLQFQIETAERLVKVLEAAVRQQTMLVKRTAFSISQAAAKDFVDEHKKTVVRLAAAIVEIYDAQKAEIDFRNSFAKLGYSENVLAPMCLSIEVDDPTDKNGNRAYYWLKEAHEYLRSDADRLADSEKASAEIAHSNRQKRLAAITAEEMQPVEGFFE